MHYLGRPDCILNDIPSIVQEMLDRGDAYGAAVVEGNANLAWLAADRPDEAIYRLQHARQVWNVRGFHLPDMFAFRDGMAISLYKGDGQAAWDLAETTWPIIQRSGLLR